MTGTSTAFEFLRPYVSRLLVDWLRVAPDTRTREIEGSLAFVDISGFTPLTERLARKGKVGAEELNDTLDACFTELLSVAYDYGAEVVKWGGDAVLLFFDGDEHAAVACRAAVEMQHTIDRIGRLRTSAGTVVLRMSIGIHSGTFRFFAVGDLHRELVITGPAATHTVLMEKAADAGEIAVSFDTAAAIDSRLLGPEKEGAILLEDAPEVPVDRAPQRSGELDLDLAGCVPVRIREHLVAGGGPEHRHVTAAFIEFGGIDAMLEQEGPQAVADALDECIRTVQHAAFEHQVTFFETDIGADGGKIVLLAGAPSSTGNDEERMLRTLRAIVETPGRLQLRIGVNAGRVFAGDFGPSFRRTYSVKGDAVNLAARLMGKAAPGQILATDPVLDRSRTLFTLDTLEPFPVKGKSHPIQAYSVGPPVGARTVRRGRVPLVGRQEELTALLSAIDSARGWSGSVVEIVAEPGMGKSRLLEEVAARSDDVPLLTATCEEYEVSTPYFPFRKLLRDALELGDRDPAEAERVLRTKVEEVAPRLAAWIPLIAIPLELDIAPTPETGSLDERFVKTRLEETIRELLALALSRPTLFVFEDVHWLDDASGDLLTALLEGIEDRPWVVVVTRREEGSHFAPPADAHPLVLRLEPLGEADAAALLEATTDQVPLSPHAVAALAQRSGGNPLFLAELAAAALDAGEVDTLPDSVEALLTAQIDKLSPRDRTILRCAAVLGVAFDRELLASALEGETDALEDDLWRRLGGLIELAEGDQVRFRHALVRDAAYEGLPYRRRRELHARVGEAIERVTSQPEEDAGLLSLHFFHAQRFAEAWRYSGIAGRSAQSIYANVEAETFYARAIETARRLPSVAGEVPAVFEALGDVRVRLGEFSRAGLAYRASRQRAQAEPSEEARLLLKEALVPWRLGRYPQALRWIRRGLRLLAGLPGEAATAQRAQLYVWHGVVRLRQGRPPEAIDWCTRAIAEAKQAGADEALAHAYYVLDYAYVALGRYDDAVYSPRALAIYERLGNLGEQAGILNNLGTFAYLQGRWEEALERYRQAEDAWERCGDRWSASFATVNRGEILSDQGKLEEAEPLFRYALRVARASGTESRVADVASHLGRLLARDGCFEEARTLLAEARDLYERGGARAEVVATEARIAECLLLQGDAATALELADEALAQAEAIEGTFLAVAMLDRLRGSALLELGRTDDARAALSRSLEEARAKAADYEIAQTLEALVALGRRAGGGFEELENERDAIVARLGVVSRASRSRPTDTA